MTNERTFKSGDEMLAAMVKETVDRLEFAIATRGHASMAVAGGRFPKPLFQTLSQARLDWSKVIGISQFSGAPFSISSGVEVTLIGSNVNFAL